MLKDLNAKRLERDVIALDQLPATTEHLGVAFELGETYAGHDVGHVAFIPCADDVILPAS